MTESFALFSLGAYRAELERVNQLRISDGERKQVTAALKELLDSEGNLAQTGTSFSSLVDQLEDRRIAPNDAKTPVELLFAFVDEYRHSAPAANESSTSGLFLFSAHLDAIRAQEDSADKNHADTKVDSFVIKDGEVLARCNDISRIVASRNKLISEYGELFAFGFRNLNDKAAYDQRVNLNGGNRLMEFLQRKIGTKLQVDEVGQVEKNDESPRSKSDTTDLSGLPNASPEQKTIKNSDAIIQKSEIGATALTSVRSSASSHTKDVHSDAKSSVESAEENLPQADDVLSEYNMGWSYEMGLGKVRRNLNEACRWYRLAIDHGDDAARGALRNLCVYAGGGFDFKAVAKWCRDLADSGDPWAQELLGWIYETGHGEVRNKTRAIEWYKKAARQGNSAAEMALRRLRV